MKKFFSEFKAFIARGDVVSMAIGIIIGASFTAIVNSLVKDVITPVIGVVLGGIDFSALTIPLKGDAQILLGNFIQAIINFLLTALVLFLIVKAVNAMKAAAEKKAKAEEAAKSAAPAPTPADIVLLTEIRDLLKK